MTTLAFHIGPVQFDQPVWLILIPICSALAVLIGWRSLSGLGGFTRWLALGVRLVVIALIAGAVARPHWRREAESVNVTVVLDASDSVRRPIVRADGKPVDMLSLATRYVAAAADRAEPEDTVARVTAARTAYVQSLPVPPRDEPDTNVIGATDGTNLAEAVNLGLAVSPGDMANRLLLVSDGNQTAGDILVSANAAKAAGVPIDVLPLRYKYDREVVAERLVAPATARMGQNANLRVLLTSRAPATGRLSLLINEQMVDLDPGGPEMSMPVALEAGSNAVTIPVSLPRAGPQQFRAVFTPDNAADDAVAQNNETMAVTFVQSEGRVLVLAPADAEVEPLVRVMTEAKIAAEVRRPTEAPKSLVEWQAFDCVVIANTPSYEFNEQQQEDLRAYVHDLGGGLVMTGGPDAFGAGGWIGSPVADALPIKLEPPQKRQMPRGALVLVMHSCEMPQGNYWGKKTAEAAVNNLSRLDLVGVIEFSWGPGDTWVYPLSPVGNRSAVMRAINSLTYGDAPSFDGMLGMAISGLQGVQAGAKHIIVISDGDPSLSNTGLLATAKQSKISISTVMVWPHNRSPGAGGEWKTMKDIAQLTNGKFYPIIDQGQFATLPSIIIKEAQEVRRSLIWEGPAFQPAVANAVTETMRGLGGEVRPISGYIVAADREGLSIVSLRGKENDPILAHWQYGLGKTVAFTSDLGARWAGAWLPWPKYRAFWEQHIRWAMRPGGSADMRVITEDQGDRTRVVVEALDQNGDRLNFVRFAGRVVGPTGEAQGVDLRQVGPGRYEGFFDSALSGAYVASFRYLTPGEPGAPDREGSLQAAVTRPFADEYRTLEDNAALLRLVADATGGRVLDLRTTPELADLWTREGLTMPVATRPIWVLVSILGIGLFLADVAVRRVRLEPAMIAAAVRSALRPGAARAGQHVGSLKEARERARRGLGTAPGDDARRVMAQQARADAATAHAKFEVSAEELARSRVNQAVPDLIDKTEKKTPPAATGQQSTQPDEGMSRLLKAKKRAKDEFDE